MLADRVRPIVDGFTRDTVMVAHDGDSWAFLDVA